MKNDVFLLEVEFSGDGIMCDKLGKIVNVVTPNRNGNYKSVKSSRNKEDVLAKTNGKS